MSKLNEIFIVLCHRWDEYEPQDSIVSFVSFNRELAADYRDTMEAKYASENDSYAGFEYELVENFVVKGE